MGSLGVVLVAMAGDLHGIGLLGNSWCRRVGSGRAIDLNCGCGLTNPTAAANRLRDVHPVVGIEATSGMVEAVVGMRWV